MNAPRFSLRLPPSVDASERRARNWLCGFVLFEIACQIALLVPFLGAVRVLVRSAAFAASLSLLVLLPGSGRRHPAQRWAMAILLIVALGLVHPATSSFLAGAAQIAMYVAILSPLFWVSRLAVTAAVFRTLLLILWGFHTLSATFGVLQMHYPGRFQPNVSSKITGLGEFADAYKTQLASGDVVWRPMGLTDTPGGAAGAGLYAAVLGLGVLLGSRSAPLRVMSVASLAVGLFCIYVSQVRSLLVMAGVCSLSLVAILMRRGDLPRVAAAIGVGTVVVVLSFFWAISIGGQETAKRLSTLVDDRFDDVYARNRGHFLKETFAVLLPEYPLGAGLARWGMMRNYFGNDDDLFNKSIWVEIQWTGWVLDGGLPLLIAYVGAIASACWVGLKIALSRLPQGMPLWGALVLALNVGTAAVTFNYPIFMSQGGMEFWLLNAALFAAAVRTARTRNARRRVPVEVGEA
jgi:hypothetical protein